MDGLEYGLNFPVFKPSVIYICICICIYINIGSRKKTTLSSRQACFVIAHSSGDFNDKNIDNHRLYTLRLYCWGKCQFKCLIVT